MWSKWRSDLKEAKGKEEFRSILLNILKIRITENMTKELDPNTFGSPTWPYLQASIIGARKELTQLLQTLDNEE